MQPALERPAQSRQAMLVEVGELFSWRAAAGAHGVGWDRPDLQMRVWWVPEHGVWRVVYRGFEFEATAREDDAGRLVRQVCMRYPHGRPPGSCVDDGPEPTTAAANRDCPTLGEVNAFFDAAPAAAETAADLQERFAGWLAAADERAAEALAAAVETGALRGAAVGDAAYRLRVLERVGGGLAGLVCDEADRALARFAAPAPDWGETGGRGLFNNSVALPRWQIQSGAAPVDEVWQHPQPEIPRAARRNGFADELAGMLLFAARQRVHRAVVAHLCERARAGNDEARAVVVEAMRVAGFFGDFVDAAAVADP